MYTTTVFQPNLKHLIDVKITISSVADIITCVQQQKLACFRQGTWDKYPVMFQNSLKLNPCFTTPDILISMGVPPSSP